MEQFFFNKSYFEMMNVFPEEDRMDFLKDVVYYGVNRTKDYSNNPLVSSVMPNIRAQIDCAKINYEKNKLRGKKGGRPREINRAIVALLKKENFTTEEIAMIMQCSVRTVQRILKPKLYDLYEERLIDARKTNYRPISMDIKRKILEEKGEKDVEFGKESIFSDFSFRNK